MKRKREKVTARICPNCKGTRFGREVPTPVPGTWKKAPQVHVQCLDCDVVLFIPDSGFISPSYCGNPKEHYFDRLKSAQ